MTVRVCVCRRASPLDWVDAEGVTLPHAVRVAVRRLGLGPGRTVSRRRVDSHVWEWNWSGCELIVRENRSGPSSESPARRRIVVSVTLSPEAVNRLDEMAAGSRTSRSAVVERLVGAVEKDLSDPTG